MPYTCKNCGAAVPEQQPVEKIRSWCQERGYRISPFEEVNEAAAAEMCDRQPETLRSWRATDRRLPCSRTKAGWRYKLSDIAAFLAEDTENDV